MQFFANDGFRNTPITADQIDASASRGLQILDESGFVYDNGVNPGSVINVAGGNLYRGCPVNVLAGHALTMDQARVLVGQAATLERYGYTVCLDQARLMLGQPQAVVTVQPAAAVIPVALAPAASGLPSLAVAGIILALLVVSHGHQ